MLDYRSQLSKVPDYTGYVQGLKRGDHALALYRDHSFKRQLAAPFFQSGLSKGYAGAYFASERKLDSDVKAIREYGVDFDSLPKEAFTVMSSDDWYLKKGKADPEIMRSNIVRLTQEKKDAGFAGLAVSGEPGFLVESGFGEECLKYEESGGRQLSTDRYALCLYNVNALKENIRERIFKSHGHVIAKDLVGKLI